MKQLTVDDLEYLALGSAILGSGGGGDPTYDLLMARYQMEQHGTVRLLDLADLDDEALVVPLAFMGAPLVGIEKIPSGRECMHLISLVERYVGKKVSALVAAEIGGANAFTPIAAAALLGLPLIDGDTIGRAFPELQMSVCHLKGINPSPTFICDSLGNQAIIEAVDGSWTETLARQLTVSMGSSAGVALYLMSGKEAKQSIIAGTLSQAVRIGKNLKSAKGLPGVLEQERGVLVGSGKIVDVDQVISEGFLKGDLKIQGADQLFTVEYQNEYLIVKEGDRVVVTTPDIIMLLEQETAAPVTSENLKNGLKVDLIALPAPKVWQTAAGLALVGPSYFGYNTEYKKVGMS